MEDAISRNNGNMDKPGQTARKLSVVITYPFPIGQASGGSRMTREIARQLSRLGADVTIMPVSSNALDRRFPRKAIAKEVLGYEFDAELAAGSVEIVRVPQHPLHYHLDGLSLRSALVKLLRRKKVDVVLSYYHEGGFLPDFLHKRGIRWGYISTWASYAMAKVGSGSEQLFRQKLEAFLHERLIAAPHRQAEILFATSEFTCNEMVEVLGVARERVRVAYLGVQPHFTKIERQKPERIRNLIYFGRVVVLKGILDAIEALGKLAQRGITDWRFRLVGEAGKPAVARANRLARQYGIMDKIEYIDAVDDAGLRKELQEADLAIMPSYSESFGLAFAEAQAAGLPVIAYEVGSLPEVIENGKTGWLVPLRDMDALGNAIATAMAEPEKTYEMGLAARTRVQQLFTWERTGGIIFNSLQDICHAKDSGFEGDGSPTMVTREKAIA